MQSVKYKGEILTTKKKIRGVEQKCVWNTNVIWGIENKSFIIIEESLNQYAQFVLYILIYTLYMHFANKHIFIFYLF